MRDEYDFSFAPQGWQCPICKRVYSPTYPWCIFCGGETVTTTTTTTNPTTTTVGTSTQEEWLDKYIKAIEEKDSDLTFSDLHKPKILMY